MAKTHCSSCWQGALAPSLEPGTAPYSMAAPFRSLMHLCAPLELAPCLCHLMLGPARHWRPSLALSCLRSSSNCAPHALSCTGACGFCVLHITVVHCQFPPLSLQLLVNECHHRAASWPPASTPPPWQHELRGPYTVCASAASLAHGTDKGEATLGGGCSSQARRAEQMPRADVGPCHFSIYSDL